LNVALGWWKRKINAVGFDGFWLWPWIWSHDGVSEDPPQAREREQKIVDNEKRVLLTYHNRESLELGGIQIRISVLSRN
jgi:hypothetical protein